MSKKAVDLTSVSMVATTLVSRGINPTVERIRKELGGGSNSTITPLLKQWKINQSMSADSPELPVEIVESIRSIYAKIQGSADEKIKIATDKHEAESASIRAELEKAQKAIIQMQKDMDKLNGIRNGLEEKCTELTKNNESLRIAESVIKSQLSESKDRIEELKTLNEEIRSESKAIQEQAAYYQTATSEERKHERESHLSEIMKLQSKIDQLITNNKNLELLKESTIGELTRLKEMIKQKDIQIQNANELIVNHRSEITAIKENHLQVLDDLSISKRNLMEVSIKNAELVTKIDFMKKESRCDKDENEELKSNAMIMSKKIDTLTNELLTLTKEKSLIEGQLMKYQAK